MSFAGKLLSSVLFYFLKWGVEALMLFVKRQNRLKEKKDEVKKAMAMDDRKAAAAKLNALFK